ncbi:hypothetical protein GGR95_003524 [Sulfitobacter undariae]|uniref:Uncharacterized protein n=1 Tax=Sulfitobacter undariae TaxID=1563671 RepID=A0A7W6E6W9_9RHOB|nr:hypothetical protein [Sulfitobacter undariae]MBB3995860.1 hypothetical protein [Sulfitobacter undariae]
MTLMALFAPAFAQGQRSFSVENRIYTGTFRHSHVPKGLFTDSYTKIAWDAELKMGLLYGEPVFSTKFRFEIEDWRYVVPSLGPTKYIQWTPSSGAGLQRVGGLPADAPRAMPYEVKLGFKFRDIKSRQFVEVIQDIGAPGKPGTWSFNVPGSPNWDKTFIGFDEPNKGSWLNAVDAKNTWKSELELLSVRIVSIKWSTADLFDYLRTYNMYDRTMATIEAINRLLDGAERSYGYDARFERPSKLKYQNTPFLASVPLKLLRQLERLQNLPEELKQGDDTAYEQAKDNAEDIVAVMEEDIRNYDDKTPRQKDLPQGSEMIFEQDGLQPIFVQLPLRFELIDHGSEDGDRVRLRVRDSSGQVMDESKTLRNAGTGFSPAVRAGSISISIEALNEGSSGPNTGTIVVHSKVTKGPSSQQYNLKTGDTGTLMVFAPAQ